MSKVIFWGLCGTLVLLPLPFGAVDEWAIFVFEAATFVLFGIHLVERACRARKKEWIIEEELEGARIPLYLKIPVFVFLGASVTQLIPLPQHLLKLLSPRTFDVYNSVASEGLIDAGSGSLRTLSFTPDLSLYLLIQYVFYFVFGYLVFKYVRTKKEAEIFVLVMIVSAVFQSVYGIAEHFGGTERILGYKKIDYIDSVTGTFINRNHFSGFLEMVLPVSLGYLLAKSSFFAMKKGLSLKEKLLWFSQERLQKCVVYGLCPVLIGMGIFFSRSRTGIFVFFVTVFFMAAALSAAGGRSERDRENERKEWMSLRHWRRERRYLRVIRTVAIVVLFAVVLVGARPIIERFSWEGLMSEQRPVIFRSTVELIGNFPLFGTGLGTYVFAYPMFDNKGFGGRVVDHAHNDYLEILAESGLVGGVAIILAGFVGVGYMFGRWTRRRHYLVRGIVLGCVAGIVAILVHSITDFNLRIPANAVYLVTLYALGMRVVGEKYDLG